MAEDRGPELAAVLGLFLGLSWLFVLLRVYVKTRMSKSWAPDDTLLIISLILYTTYSTCATVGIRYGTGQHLTSIPETDIPKALSYWWICELLYALTTVFIRISIAVFLLRLCVKPVHRYIVHGTLVFVCLFSTFYFFLVLFQCSPYSYFWEQYDSKKGSCINPAVVPIASIVHSVVSFAADWILGLLPVALLYDLNLNRRSKISVAGLLSLGLLAGVATLIRIPYIRILGITDDFLFVTLDVAIWSTIEPGLGIVAFAGATLRPLFLSFYGMATRQGRSSHSRSSRGIRLGDGNGREWERRAERSARRVDADIDGLGSEDSGSKKGLGRVVVSKSDGRVDEDVRMKSGDGSQKTVDTGTSIDGQMDEADIKGKCKTDWHTYPPRNREDMV